MNDFSFVILCPERNLGGLRTTASHCRDRFGVPYRCVVAGDVSKKEVAEMAGFCPITQAGTTITSLINAGIRESETPWSLIVMAGSILKPSVVDKYKQFTRSKKDVLYPVIDRKIPFDEASINGILIHKDAIDEVGPLPEEVDDLPMAKLYWAAEAIHKGYQFKALVGARFC